MPIISNRLANLDLNCIIPSFRTTLLTSWMHNGRVATITIITTAITITTITIIIAVTSTSTSTTSLLAVMEVTFSKMMHLRCRLLHNLKVSHSRSHHHCFLRRRQQQQLLLHGVHLELLGRLFFNRMDPEQSFLHCCRNLVLQPVVVCLQLRLMHDLLQVWAEWHRQVLLRSCRRKR